MGVLGSIVLLHAIYVGGTEQKVPDPDVSIAGITVGMSEKQLLGLGYPTKKDSIRLEGDEYDQYFINLGQGVEVFVTFTQDGLVYEIGTKSLGYKDSNGVGIDTKLAELCAIYPQGNLIGGYADGLYLNYVVNSGEQMTIFSFETAGISEKCILNVESCRESLQAEAVSRFYIR